MVKFIISTAATAMLLASSMVLALPTSKKLDTRAPEFHGHPEADAAVAPLPHGWYGHDATASQDRSARLAVRNAGAHDTEAAPLPHGWYGHDATTPKERYAKLAARSAGAAAAAEIDSIVGPLNVARHVAEDDAENEERTNAARVIGHGGAKKAERFADAGAEFPRLHVDERAATAGPLPVACEKHNGMCRGLEKKQAKPAEDECIAARGCW